MDGDSDDSNNDDGVDGGCNVNINGDDDANCNDGESIVDCGDDKDGGGGDSIGNGGIALIGDRDPHFRDGKTKIGCSDDTAGDDDNSDNDGGPNDSGGVDTNYNYCH